MCSQCHGIADNEDDQISPEKHLGDKSFLVHYRSPLFAISAFGVFGPNFFHVFQQSLSRLFVMFVHFVRFRGLLSCATVKIWRWNKEQDGGWW